MGGFGGAALSADGLIGRGVVGLVGLAGRLDLRNGIGFVDGWLGIAPASDDGHDPEGGER